MKTLKANGIRKISQDKNGNPLNIFVINLVNGKPAVIRTAKEFLTDLKNSFLIGEYVNNTNHPELRQVLRDLSSGVYTITGNIKHVKKGDKWTVTENSSAVTNPSHPAFNKVAVGDQLPYQKDQSIVEDGFLQVNLNPTIRQENKDALYRGVALANLMAMDEEPSSTVVTGDDYNSSADDFDIDDDVITHAKQTEEQPEEEFEETTE